MKLKKWNRDVFGDIQKKKEKLTGDLKRIQDILEITQTDDLLNQEEMLLKEFDIVLKQEEILWHQKSRAIWIVSDVRNTKYFHTSTIIRRRRNRIESLKDDNGT